ncbi:DUF1919 domain-containing protein [Oscillospiraceae bacterium 50-58]
MNLVYQVRKIYNCWRGSRLHSHPTVISRNCVGGVLFHDLGLKFLSPTINMTMSGEDFILLCQHLEDFLAVEMEEVADHAEDYPVGRLNTEYGSITLDLVHYDTFQSAAESWERRKKRVDLNNIRIIFHIEPPVSPKLVEQFERLPYAHKVLLSSGIDIKQHPDCYNLPCYAAGHTRSIERYRSKYSIRRCQDEYDWVSFLNGDPQ